MGLVGGVLAVGALTAIALDAPPSPPAALDPASTTSSGTKGLILLLHALGAEAHVGPVVPTNAKGVALLLDDRLSSLDRRSLRRWVDAGGELVSTDPLSPLSDVRFDESTQDATVSPAPEGTWPGCAIGSLSDVHHLDIGGSQLLQPEAGQVGCFPAGHGDYVVIRRQGAGTVVVVATPNVWTNGSLGHDDDSVLAADLLVPPTGTQLTVIGASPVGSGTEGLLGLISPHLIEALWGLVAALVVAILWRARRLGRPVPDRVPVELPGSGLVVATGHLLQEGRHRATASEALRQELRMTLDEQVGTPRDLPDADVAAIAAERTGVPAPQVLAALTGPVPEDDAALTALGRQVEHIRSEVVRVR